MDNATDELELRRILKEMRALAESNSAEQIAELVELKAKWHRYHVVSASLKQEIHSKPSCNLLAAIKAELEQEAVPTRSLTHKVNGKGVFRTLGQGAIAASVAIAVLFTTDLALVADNADSAGNAGAAQLAGSDTANDANEQLPGLTGNLNPATNTRIAIQDRIGPEEMSRLERAVSEELEDSLENREVPATFNPDNPNNPNNP